MVRSVFFVSQYCVFWFCKYSASRVTVLNTNYFFFFFGILEIERSKYDSYDASGMRPDEFEGDFGPEDFFNFFSETSSRHGFSGYGYEQQGTEPKPPPKKKGGKTEDGHVDFPITLEELYKGKVVKFTSHRNKLCPSCQGYVLFFFVTTTKRVCVPFNLISSNCFV